MLAELISKQKGRVKQIYARVIKVVLFHSWGRFIIIIYVDLYKEHILVYWRLVI